MRVSNLELLLWAPRAVNHFGRQAFSHSSQDVETSTLKAEKDVTLL